MQFSLGPTFSNFLFVASFVLLAWTAVAQGAAINPERARADIVGIGKDSLSRRAADDSRYMVAASKEEEASTRRNSDLSRRVNAPVDDVWHTATELPLPTEFDLSMRQESDMSDYWYSLSTDIETGKTEGGELVRRVEASPDDMWYTLRSESEESE